jgi:hypothetical protein
MIPENPPPERARTASRALAPRLSREGRPICCDENPLRSKHLVPGVPSPKHRAGELGRGGLLAKSPLRGLPGRHVKSLPLAGTQPDAGSRADQWSKRGAFGAPPCFCSYRSLGKDPIAWFLLQWLCDPDVGDEVSFRRRCTFPGGSGIGFSRPGAEALHHLKPCDLISERSFPVFVDLPDIRDAGPLVRTSARLMRKPGGLDEADPVSLK